MAGLDHEFLLVSCNEYNYSDYLKLLNNPQAVLLHDNLLSYLSDTLKWIPCYIPRSKNKLVEFEGLAYYGVTIIKEDGATIMRKIFNLWADLLSNAPENLKLTGNFGWIEGEDSNSGKYEIIKIQRDEIVKSLRKIAGYAEEVENSGGKLFILHLGL
ncbi:MAG TPA: hypothetical protein PKY82_06275 [Pyrinomonadaceae bacterium]|nr:hypothetical protein [Pyrinomonadaceae bacterium]